MSKRVKLAPADPDVKVTLGEGDDERTFRMVAVTIDIEEELDEIDQEMSEFAGRSPVERMGVSLKQLDVLLKPADGGKRKPSDILLPAYKGGQTTAMAISKLIEDLVQAARPI